MGAGATVTAATWSIYNTAKLDGGTETQGLVDSTPGASIDASDYANFTVDSDTTVATKTINATTTSAYNDYTLDATGLTYIQVAGTTCLGLRLSKDYAETSSHASAPGTSATHATYSTSEEAGTGQDPKMAITYTAAPAAVVPVNPIIWFE